ncbi:MAG: glycosyltransferase family 4 protein [Armatimonadetes bacterium]|nr:glycosyltransferase family 4 protein [Armatimonadota bacterium]
MTQRYTVLQLITPHRFGGAERVVANLPHRLIGMGHRVVVAGPPREQLFLDYLAELEVPFEPLNIAGKINPWAVGRICDLARRLKADIIHTHLSSASIHGIAAARRLGTPSVGHVHGMNSPRWYRGATVVLAGTHGIANHLVRQGLKGQELRVIYYGIPPEPFDHLRPVAELRAELGLQPGDRPIGVLAGLVWRKGHRYLIEAVAHLRARWPDLRCLVIGSGRILPDLRELARKLRVQDQVVFLGWRTDALDVMQVLDLHVLPSTEIEGFGLCIIEAAFLGIPTVASRLPGVDEAVLDGETGLLVPPRDSKALAEAIERLLVDEGFRRRLGEAARARARELFTDERMARDIAALYHELLAGQASRH